MPARWKNWQWAGAGIAFLVAVGGSLAYTGKLPVPTSAYRIRPLQDWLPVPAPEWKVGDSWVYESTFGGVSSPKDVMAANGKLEFRVAMIDGDRIKVRVAGSSGATFLAYDRQGNLAGSEDLDTTGGDFSRAARRFDPPLHWRDFPLRTGKTWQVTSKGKIRVVSTWYSDDKQASAASIAPKSATVSGRVLGWERDIGTLDGEMVDGLKIRTEVVDDNGKLVQTMTEWYVPAAGRAVLQHIEYSYGYHNSATRRLAGFTASDPTNATGKE
jgi:hypothetical protein